MDCMPSERFFLGNTWWWLRTEGGYSAFQADREAGNITHAIKRANTFYFQQCEDAAFIKHASRRGLINTLTMRHPDTGVLWHQTVIDWSRDYWGKQTFMPFTFDERQVLPDEVVLWKPSPDGMLIDHKGTPFTDTRLLDFLKFNSCCDFAGEHG